MTKPAVGIVAIMAAVALVGTLGLTVVAGNDEPEGQEGGFLHRLHEMGQHLHGAHHSHNSMAGLIEELELDPEQRGHLERIHERLATVGQGAPGEMAELHDRLIAQFEQGQIDTGEVHKVIDGHLDQVREIAYGVTDELIALVNGLDARQREILLAHLQDHADRH